MWRCFSRVAEGSLHHLHDPEGITHLSRQGPSRMEFSKPVIAAVNGWAVAGGLELALMCDIRVVEENSRLGVLCRRFGVPLTDGGTVRYFCCLV